MATRPPPALAGKEPEFTPVKLRDGALEDLERVSRLERASTELAMRLTRLDSALALLR